MSGKKNKLIVVTGPTGVGKTELCLALAEYYAVDIINADSRQIYSGIPIGTAAPTASQMQRVRHYFVANHRVGDYFSASMYEEQVLSLLDEKSKDCENGVLAILTGGSMMYIDAVCNGIDDIPTVDDATRELMKRRYEQEGLEALLDELKSLDPEYWETVDRNNPRRVVHALEICHVSGRTYTSFRTGEKKQRPFDVIKIGLTLDTVERVKRGQVIMNHDALYERINARVEEMIRLGLEEEARSMLPFRHENSLNTVGYKEMFKYFDGEIDMEEAVRQIQSHTREYARKQLTWFKKDPDIKWFSPFEIEEIKAYIDEKLEF